MDPKTMRERIHARMPNAGRWFDIRNQTGDKAIIRIYDHIDPFGVTAEDFANELERVTASEIEVQINSPGGLVFDGLAIYNALRTHPAHVTTRVDGIAASAASIIVQAGDKRVMVESAQLMIHEAWGMAVGPAEELREFADLLDKQNDVIAAIYAGRSDKDVAEFREIMRKDTYLTDQESVELGLADDIYVPPRKNDDGKNSVEVNIDGKAVYEAATTDADDHRRLKLVTNGTGKSATLTLGDVDLTKFVRSVSVTSSVDAVDVATIELAAPYGLDIDLPSEVRMALQTPSAGEREEPAPDAGEQPEPITPEQRDALLGALTLNRKEAP